MHQQRCEGLGRGEQPAQGVGAAADGPFHHGPAAVDHRQLHRGPTRGRQLEEIGGMHGPSVMKLIAPCPAPVWGPRRPTLGWWRTSGWPSG
ncbi:hypothetical protein ACFFX0_08075 [Citricoccus parietis]|uniref:Uncharacterized protein n=1 Tax=Citricoccus parietis TaxID=592307 RepID=A0ABV5FWU9_9MICC